MAHIENAQAPNLLQEAKHKCNELEKQIRSLGIAYITVVSAVVIGLVTIAIEIANFRFALRQMFPPLSSGDPHANTIFVLQFALGAAIIMTHILLTQSRSRFGERFNWCLDFLGICAIALLLFGAMTFLPASIIEGGGESGGNRFSTLTLAILLTALFPISVLSNHYIFIKLAVALDKIEMVRAIRRDVAEWKMLIAASEQCNKIVADASGALEVLDAGADEIEWHVAVECAAVVEKAVPIYNGYMVEREILEQNLDDPTIVSSLPETIRLMSIKRLREICDSLASVTPQAIFQTIKAREI